jgi:hypothetical protein
MFVPALAALPFRLANLTALREDLFHQIISGKGPLGAPPVLGTSNPSLMRKQLTDLSLQSCHSFFQGRSGHD